MSDQERIAQLEADLAEQKFLVKRARADRDELKRIHLEEVTVREKATEHVWAMNTRLRDERRRLEHARRAIKAGWLSDVNPDLLDHALGVALEAVAQPPERSCGATVCDSSARGPAALVWTCTGYSYCDVAPNRVVGPAW